VCARGIYFRSELVYTNSAMKKQLPFWILALSISFSPSIVKGQLGDVFNAAFKSIKGVNLWMGAPVGQFMPANSAGLISTTGAFSVKFDALRFGRATPSLGSVVYVIVSANRFADPCGCKTVIDSFYADAMQMGYTGVGLDKMTSSELDRLRLVRDGIEITGHSRTMSIKSLGPGESCACSSVQVDSIVSYQRNNYVRLNFGYDYTDNVPYMFGGFNTHFPLGGLHLQTTVHLQALQDWNNIGIGVHFGLGATFYPLTNAYGTVTKDSAWLLKVNAPSTLSPEVLVGFSKSITSTRDVQLFVEGDWQWVIFRDVTFDPVNSKQNLQDIFPLLPTKIDVSRFRLILGLSFNVG